ncbi:MAG: formate--tetrahydrofolate ligase [Alphaproteobacteria bacterium]|nr:formate--tetrahydrofolate ligase [Alphaproteobacteria bacterium]
MLTDIEIANNSKPFKINKIAKKLHLATEDYEPYGYYKAKLNYIKSKPSSTQGKLILVTAMTPTPAGEGKSTVSIGLADALQQLKKNVCLSLREPSMGPCFGLKGGATGGGYSQVVPMSDINLNFTGDIHAITAANNLLAAMIDNHIKYGNELKIKEVLFKRCLDLNDRSLRNIKIGLGGKINGSPRQDGFNISVASEIMAILCLSENLIDLKKRLEKIVIAKDINNSPIYAKDIKAAGAMAAILKDAIRPNLVQTLEHTPALIHGGPFANIAHGTSSVIAAKIALNKADYVITEAGFGADLGAEKFFDIFARKTNLYPSAIILVATVRALKMHGHIAKTDLDKENLTAIKKGFCNLQTHIKNLEKFGYRPIVAINHFTTDTPKELELVKALCQKEGIKAIITQGWEKGGKGCINLAQQLLSELEQQPHAINGKCLYNLEIPIKQKINCIATEIYGAKRVRFSKKAEQEIETIEQWGYKNLPICMAKTQNSISHDKTKLGAPKGYVFPITEVRLAAGAGFIVVLSGSINTMPGLPKYPAAEKIDVDATGNISGLF